MGKFTAAAPDTNKTHHYRLQGANFVPVGGDLVLGTRSLVFEVADIVPLTVSWT